MPDDWPTIRRCLVTFSVPTFPDQQSSCCDRLSCSTSAGVRSGQPCIGAFCSWHEIDAARLLAWKNRAEIATRLWFVVCFFICVTLSSFSLLSFWCRLWDFVLNIFHINILWGLIFHEFHDFWRVDALLTDTVTFKIQRNSEHLWCRMGVQRWKWCLSPG